MMIDELNIRKMKEEDVEQVMDLVMRLKRLNAEFDSTFDVVEDSDEEIRQHIAEAAKDQKNHIVFVGSVGSKIVGIVRVDLHSRIYYKPKTEARIVEFYVMPEFRRKNLGRMLMNEVYDELNKKGIKLVTAEFPALNLIALEFYKKIGYREIVSVYGKCIGEKGERLEL